MSDHGHSHGPSISSGGLHRKKLLIVLGITSTVLVAELIGSAVTGSLALLADAGHMFTDVAGILLAVLAVTFASRPATPQRTFGYYRLEILAAVVNAVLLFGESLAPDGWQVEQVEDGLVVRLAGRATQDRLAHERVVRALHDLGVDRTRVEIVLVPAIERTALGKAPLVKGPRTPG